VQAKIIQKDLAKNLDIEKFKVNRSIEVNSE